MHHVRGLEQPVALVLDHYEVFRLMDTWLRQVLVPSLPPGVSLVLAGRERPVTGWFALDGFRGLPLHPLDEADARSLLERLGVHPSAAARLNRIARGHPLALMLASAGVAEHPELGLEEAALTRVVEELTRLHLEVVDDARSRRALEAASVVRRVTEPVLRAMLDDEPDGDAVLSRLLDAPFVDAGRDGLVVHEAFFPSGAQPLAVEPARTDDERAICVIARRHEGPDACALLERWWRDAPETFSAIRNRDGAVAGFFALFEGRMLRRSLVAGDPVLESWARDLHDHPLPKGQLALGLRRWLDVERGELPCASQAACWLDVKRAYMALRPALRRMYVLVHDVPTYWPVVEQLGFRPLTDGVVVLDEREYATVVLDFGPGSVDGWLTSLVAHELGVRDEPELDEHARELAVQGRRVSLTPLELGLFRHLREREGSVVARNELLLEVWGTDFTGGSNVVDAVVRTLRHKLGSAGAVVETVRGSGYRLRADWRAHVS